MTTNPCDFESLRIKAAKLFAQTMIFVDDQASQHMFGETSPGNLHAPVSGIERTMPDNELKEQDGTGNSGSRYAFNAKSLIDSAMNLGLICSVLRPEKGEKFQNRVASAAQVADIVCLDWEIYDDGGQAALDIINEILERDANQSGRLRLIAIYTGAVANKDKIMELVLEAIPEEIREKQDFIKTTPDSEITNNSGVRIVCLLKKRGVRLDNSISKDQVCESELPQRLQSEFARLSEGLLSNAALATIASIRNSTHHVLSKFVGRMDGPFFHHRAMIDNPEDAEEYAINIVLSELKGAINKQQVGKDHTGRQAIGARIREFANSSEPSDKLTLYYEKGADPKTYELEIGHAIKMVSDGLSRTLKDPSVLLKNRPGKKDFKKSLSSLFSSNLEKARLNMDQFAALTGVQTYPGSYLCRSGAWLPKLGLGTIIQDKNKTYFMCLQASCDSVRISDKGNFLFVSLDEKNNRNNEEPDHIVPIPSDSNKVFKYIGLSTSSKSYRATQTIKFSGSKDTETVNAEKNGQSPSFCFKDTAGNKYVWVADLKRRRALRAAQRLAQDMGRLGFDEFEPYRITHKSG